MLVALYGVVGPLIWVWGDAGAQVGDLRHALIVDEGGALYEVRLSLFIKVDRTNRLCCLQAQHELNLPDLVLLEVKTGLYCPCTTAQDRVLAETRALELLERA